MFLFLKERGLINENKHRSTISNCLKSLTVAWQHLQGDYTLFFQREKSEAIRFQSRNLDWQFTDFLFSFVALSGCEHTNWEMSLGVGGKLKLAEFFSLRGSSERHICPGRLFP